MAAKQYIACLVSRNPFFLAGSILLLMLFQGCTGINTFPTIARPGDTVSMMLGGSEMASKDTIDVTLTQGSSSWDLADPDGDGNRSDSLIRSIFEVRTDGRANGLSYGSGNTVSQIWAFGHEPVQSIMIIDLPTVADGLTEGDASLDITLNVSDNSSSTPTIFSIDLTLVDVPGTTGEKDNFYRSTFAGAIGADFTDLEPAPHGKISFGPYNQLIHAASLEIEFNEANVTPSDISVYIPEAVIGGSLGANQRMAYWRQDGDKLYIDVVSPEGIKSQFLKAYVMHPHGASNPDFAINNATFYNQDGVDITIQENVTSTLDYYP